VRENRRLIFMSLILFLIWGVVFILEAMALVFIYSIASGERNINTNQYEFAYFIRIEN
jgi:hypothetical protein